MPVIGQASFKEASVLSASTCDIGATDQWLVTITGTTTITSFGTEANKVRFLKFSDALTLTHNGTSLILPGGANITTAAGDTAIASSDDSGDWTVRDYTRAASAADTLLRATRSITGSSDTLVAGDLGKTIVLNRSSAIALAVTAAATLGNGWYCDLININSGVATIDANSSETIDGATTASMYQGERLRLVCDGSAFYTLNHAGECIDFAPVITPTSGSFAGGNPTVTGSWVKKIRTSVHLHVQFTLPSNTSGGTGNLSCPLPSFGTPLGDAVIVGGSLTSGLVHRGLYNGSTFVIGNYGNATVIANSAKGSLFGQYRVAP